MAKSKRAETYLRLLKMADRRPLRALREWLDKFAPALPGTAASLAYHERAFNDLADQATAAVSTDESDELQELVSRARVMLREGLDRAEEAPLREPIFVTIPTGRRATRPDESAVSARPCPPDITRLQAVAASWNHHQRIKWLCAAFEQLEGGDSRPHLAFAPVRLYPIGRYVEQFGASLLEGRDCGVPTVDDFIASVATYLREGRPIVPHPQRCDIRFWRLYGSLELIDPKAETALQYVLRADPRLLRSDELVGAICRAVHETTPSPSVRAWLFDRIAGAVRSPVLSAWRVIEALNEVIHTTKRTDIPPELPAACFEIVRHPSAAVELELTRLLDEGSLEDDGQPLFGHSVRDVAELRASVLDRRTEGAEPLRQPAAREVALWVRELEPADA